MSDGQIIVKTKLDNSQLQRELSGLKGLLQGATAGFSDSLKSIGMGLTHAGASLTAGLTVPIIAAGKSMLQVGMDFEKAMSAVKAVTGASADEFKILQKAAIDWGKDTIFSTVEVAEGMKVLGQTGASTNDILKAMPGIMALAATEEMGLARATDITTSVLKGFRLPMEDAAHVADVLAMASVESNATVSDLGETMKYTAPFARLMGQDLETAAAAAMVMHDAGIKGSMAGTALRGAFVKLAKPAGESKKALDRLGLSFYDAGGKAKTMEAFMLELETSLEGATQEEKNFALAQLFGTHALSGMVAVTEEGSVRLAELAQKLRDSGGTAKEIAAIMKDNVAGDWEQAMSSMEAAGTEFFIVIAPLLREIAMLVKGFADALAETSPATKMWIMGILAIAAAVGPVLLVLGQLFIAAGAISTAFAGGFALPAILAPLALVTAGIYGLIAGFKYLMDTNEDFRNRMINAWMNIKKSFGVIIDSITLIFRNFILTMKQSGVWAEMTSAIMLTWTNIKLALNAIWTAIAKIFEAVFGKMAFFMASHAGIIHKGLVGGWTTAWNAIYPIWQKFNTEFYKIFSGMLEYFQTWNGDFGKLWDDIKTKIESALAPIREKMNEFSSFLKDKFGIVWDDIGGRIIAFIAIVGRVALAFKPLIMAFTGASGVATQFSAVIAAITSPIGLVITAVALLVAGFVHLMNTNDDFKERMISAWETISKSVETIIDSLIEGFKAFIDTISNGDSIRKMGENLLGTWEAVETGLNAIWTIIAETAEAVFGGIADFLEEYSTEIFTYVAQVWEVIWDFINPIWEKINTALTEFFGGIIEYAQKWGEDLREIFSGALELAWIVIKAGLDFILGLWDVWGDEILTVVGAFWDVIVAVFEAAWRTIGEVVTFALEVIKNVIDIWIAIFQGDWDTVWKSIGNILKATWDFIVNVLKIAWELIVSILKAAWEVISTAVVALWEIVSGKFKEIAKAISDWVSAAWEKLSGWFKDVVKGFKDWAVDTGKAINEWVLDVAKAFDEWVKDVAKGFEEWNKNVSKVINDWGTNTAKSFETWNKDVSKTINDWGTNQIKTFDKWNADVSKKVNDWGKTTLDSFNRWNTDVSKTVNDWGAKQGTTFDKWNTDVSKKINDWGSSTAKGFSEWASNTGKTVSEWASKVGESISKWVENAKKTISEMWENTKKAFSDGASAVATKANEIKEKVTTSFNEIKTKVTEIWNNIKTAITEAITQAKESAVQKLNELVTAVRQKFDEAVTKAREFKDNIVNAIKNIDLFSIGKNIIQGLIDGIGSMATAAWNAAVNIGNSIKNTLSGLFRTRSPSKWAFELGEYIDMGLINGLHSMVSDVKKQSMELGKAVTDSMTPEPVDMDFPIPEPEPNKYEALGRDAGKSFSEGMKNALEDANLSVKPEVVSTEGIKAPIAASSPIAQPEFAKMLTAAAANAFSAATIHAQSSQVAKEAAIKEVTINQEVNINQPVETPAEVARALKQANKELAGDI